MSDNELEKSRLKDLRGNPSQPKERRAMIGRTAAGAWTVFALVWIFTACTMPEVRTAKRFEQQGNWDAAVAAYRSALRKKPFDEDLRAELEIVRGKAAQQHYEQGQTALQENRLSEAIQEFNLALSLEATRPEYQSAASEVLRLKEARDKLQNGDKLRSVGRLDEALQAYEQAVQLDPALKPALDAITDITHEKKAERALGPSTQPITLRFQNARLKEVFEILARAGGINVVFDKEFRDEPVSIFIKDTPFSDALNMILNTNNLFSRRVGPDTLLIIPNTKPKQDQYQDQMIRTFYLSNSKAKDLVNALRTMLDSKRVYVNEPLNSIVIRDQPEKIRLAERIILANDRRDSEVEFDIEVLEINRSMTQKLGLSYAKAAGAGVVPPPIPSNFSFGDAVGITLKQLTSLSPQAVIFSLPLSATLDFFKSESQAKTLANPKLRVANNKKGTINVGDKQPILLSTTNVLPGQAATGAVPTTSTVTSIEFKDVGVKLTIEPTVHLINEVTLKLTIEVTRLGDLVTLQQSPLIQQFRFGTRTAETTLNLKDSETAVLAGLIQDEERKTRTGVPYLMDIPYIGKLFTFNQTDTVSTEVMLTLTPRVLRNVTTPDMEAQAFWSGTENHFATTPLYTDAAHRVAQKTSFRKDGTGMALATVPTGERGLNLQPSRFVAFIGQEFSLDLTADHGGEALEGPVMLTYDPERLEFKRVVEGGEVTAILGPGRVELRLGRQEKTAGGNEVLGTLRFLAKANGSGLVEVQAPTPGKDLGKGDPVMVARGQVLIH